MPCCWLKLFISTLSERFKIKYIQEIQLQAISFSWWAFSKQEEKIGKLVITRASHRRNGLWIIRGRSIILMRWSLGQGLSQGRCWRQRCAHWAFVIRREAWEIKAPVAIGAIRWCKCVHDGTVRTIDQKRVGSEFASECVIALCRTWKQDMSHLVNEDKINYN